MGRKSSADWMSARREMEEEKIERMLSHIKRKSGSQLLFRVLPPLHYQTGDRSSKDVVDQIGGVLVESGLDLLPNCSIDNRWYGIEEKVSGINGAPITTVNVFSNSNPLYTMIRPDGLNDRIVPRGSAGVVTAQLRVDNPIDVPTLVMALMFGPIPKYDEVREKLFALTTEIPLVDDSAYRDFVQKYSEIDNWLVSRES